MAQKAQQCTIFSKVFIYSNSGMISGELGKQFDKNLTFKMNVSQFRRRQLLESMMSDNKEKK